MTGNQLLVDRVRSWATRALPHEPSAADRAVNVALVSYAAGASVDEACHEARIFLSACARHPSSPRPALTPLDGVDVGDWPRAS